MGDGIQKKYALIVNGDTEPRHLGNVDRAVTALKKEGRYHIAVASPERPASKVDEYTPPEKESLDQLIEGLALRTDDDDLVVVYVTGHGSREIGEGKDYQCVQEKVGAVLV